MTGHHVVIGGGMAGGRAAEFLAVRGRLGGRVLLVGGEPARPYHRPHLSKQLLATAHDDPYFRPEAYYAAKGVELRLGVRAVGLNPQTKTVRLDDGTTVDYGGVVLAPGTVARRLNVPGADLPGVEMLRTIADARAVRAALVPNARVVVVGGGFIGTEVAAAAVAAGASVTVVEASAAPLAAVLGAEVSGLLQRMHERTGVAFRTATTVRALHGDERVREVELAGGERLGVDLVVVGIGGTPDVGWLAGSGVRLDDGIVVDELCRTSLPDVVAAGDAVRWTHPAFGRLRIEHETNAQNQGVAAARSLLGQAVPYGGLPHVWSDQGDLALRLVGHAQGWDEVVVTRAAGFTAAYCREGRVVAVLTVNEPGRLAEAEGLLRDGPFPVDAWPGRRVA